MSIDIRVDGVPGEIHSCANWLRGSLAAGVDRCLTAMHSALGQASSGWQGPAGQSFQDRIGMAASKVDGLRAGIEATANAIDSYAQDLATAKAGMRRARQIATQADLEVNGTTIMDPGPSPALIPLPFNDLANQSAVNAHHSSLAAISAHQRKVEAYQKAEEEARRAREILNAAKDVGQRALNDLQGNPVVHAADFVGGVVAGLAITHVNTLKKQAQFLMEGARLAEQRYLNARTAADRAYYSREAYKRFLEGDQAERRAASAGRRVGSRVPIVGLGVTALGIGNDIHQGKPVGKSVISGGGGAILGGMAAGAAAGAIGGPPGIIIGAGVGTLVGVGAGAALDYGYDRLPDGVKNGIEDGFDAVGDGVSDAWDAVF